MPLRLLKRTSKQYNVVSKTTFVISVELLDNGTMECTLDADSSGKDCLLNISQRLGLHQPEFFGLRYISRGVPPRQRWVELERPLKKQLEKHAQDSQLSLGVMFYVSDVNLLKDEMARYHYFLQLKSDVIDGKLNCNIDQAISLAAYSLQAEFGDYDPERHTTEYLRDFAILPKELTNEEKYADSVNLDALYEAVARQYGSLVGFPPPLAEIYYIMVAQQLDGYGQEAYPAKDDAGNDILICVSLNGLVIRRRDWTHVAVFRWSDIKSIIGHKRLFVVEKAQSQRTMQFHFTDPEVAKYVRKMCILQSTFYKQNIQGGGGDSSNSNLSSSSSSSNMLMSEGNHGHHGHFTSHAEGPSPSSTSTLTFGGGGGNGSGIVGMGMRSTPDLIAPISSMTMPMSLTNLPGRLNSLNSMGGGSQYSLNNNCNNLSNSGFSLHLLQHGPTSATGTMGQQQQQQQYLHSIQQQQQQQQQQMSMTQHGHSLGHGLNVNGALSPSADDLQSLQNLLPSYRQAPDYDTAVQLKYGHGVTVGGGSSQIYYEGGNSGSQSDEEPIYQNEIVSQMHSIELRDSGTGTTGASPATASIPSNLNGSIKSNLNTNASMTVSNPVLAPNPNPTITTTITVTGEPLSQIQSQKLNTSSTNLNQNHTHSQQTDSQGQADQADDPHMYMYKPPPPYPGQVQGQSAALLLQQTQVQLQQQQQQPLDGSNLNGKIGRSSDNVTFVDLYSTGVVVGTVTPVVAAGISAPPQNKITVTTGSGTIIQNQEIIEIRGNAIAAPQVSPLPSSTDTYGHGSKKHSANFKSGSARSSNASITNNNNKLSATTTTTSVAENSSPGNTKRSTSGSVTGSTGSGSGSGTNTVLVSSVSSVSAKEKVSVNNKLSTSTVSTTSLPTATVSTLPSPSTNGGASATVTAVTASSSSLPAAPAKYSSNTNKSSSSGSGHHHKKEHSSQQKQGHGHQSKDGKLYGKSIDENILLEYQGIRKAKNAPNFATALKRENSKRNRFPNILPYDDNSIRLNPSRHNPTGYINASPVSAHISGRDWKYLVGQIPLAGNGPAVWQMIWETEAKIIASLERDSTAPFYPPLDNYAPMVFNDFQLTENKERSNNGTTIAREFILTYLPKKKQRKVWILPYEEEWKDDVPIHTEHFLCFLEEVNSIQRKVSDPSTPLVVLCGTGAGRSGVLILSDLLLHAADSGHKLRCDNLLGELRTQRMMLVSSAPQYAFVLHTLAKYLAQSRLI